MAASSPFNPHLPPLEPPATPILLYIGAGYDLSPLLTFSPQGSYYPIAPLNKNTNFCYPAKDSYTSFVFVDAKPRHTYAFMVPDFDQWKDVDSRIKNVLHYSQGLLTRWRCVPGADDLIIFEGGGDEEHAHKRVSDPDWHCISRHTIEFQLTTRLFHHKRAHNVSHQPLTTVYYLFNTLDVEITQSPRMEKMWSRVEALYVHGLMIHRSTGSGLSHSAMPNPLSPSHPTTLPRMALGDNLKRVYVLVGSWGGKTGVQHVDFIKKARARLSSAAKDTSPPIINPMHMLHPHDSTTLAEDVPISTSIPALPSLPDSASLIPSFTICQLSSDEPISVNEVSAINQSSPSESRSSLESFCSQSSSSSPSSHAYSSTSVDDFHIPIPQIAWSDKLNNGKGGYYISRTAEDCLKLVLEGRRHSEEDSRSENGQNGERPHLNLQHRRRRIFSKYTKGSTFPTALLRLRTRKVRIQDIDTTSSIVVAKAAVSPPKDARSPNIDISASPSRASFEYYEDFSATVFSPTSTIFVPPIVSPKHPHEHRHSQSQSSLVSSDFIAADDQNLSNLGAESTWARLRHKFVLLLVRRHPFSSPSSNQRQHKTFPNEYGVAKSFIEAEDGLNGANHDGVTFW